MRKTIKIKSEKRQIIEDFLGGISLMALIYIYIWAVYLLAPESWIK